MALKREDGELGPLLSAMAGSELLRSLHLLTSFIRSSATSDLS